MVKFYRWFVIMLTVGKAISNGFKAISSSLEKVGGALIIVMMLAIVTEVTLRTFWGLSTRIAYDLVGILLGCSIFLGLGEAYRRGAHIRIHALIRRLPENARNILNVVVLLVTLFYAYFIFRYSLALASSSFQLGALSQTPFRLPLFPFQVILPIGTFVFILMVIICREVLRSR